MLIRYFPSASTVFFCFVFIHIALPPTCIAVLSVKRLYCSAFENLKKEWKRRTRDVAPSDNGCTRTGRGGNQHGGCGREGGAPPSPARSSHLLHQTQGSAIRCPPSRSRAPRGSPTRRPLRKWLILASPTGSSRRRSQLGVWVLQEAGVGEGGVEGAAGWTPSMMVDSGEL